MATGSLQNWYNSINKNQKILLWLASGCLVFVYGAGLVPLVLLMYLQLGIKNTSD